MRRTCTIVGCLHVALLSSLAVPAAASAAAPPKHQTIRCPYLEAEPLKFDVPAKVGELPAIEFDYPSKVTRFSFRAGRLLMVAMDETESSRLRIKISAKRNKASGTYDGKIFVDMGGHQLQWHRGPVSCTVSR